MELHPKIPSAPDEEPLVFANVKLSQQRYK